MDVSQRQFCRRYGIDKFLSNRFIRGSVVKALKQIGALYQSLTKFVAAIMMLLIMVGVTPSSRGTTGWIQIATPDLQPEGELALSFQLQDEKLGNPYQAQAEMGLMKRLEIAVFRGFEPNEFIFGTEIGLLTENPYLLSAGFVNWSPHSHVDPQPFIEAGYYGDHHKFMAGVIHVGFRNEAMLGYAYTFNDRWQAVVDWQSGSGNSSTIGFTWNITPDLQVTPAIWLTNDSPHEVLGFVTFSYTFHLWGGKKDTAPSAERIIGAK